MNLSHGSAFPVRNSPGRFLQSLPGRLFIQPIHGDAADSTRKLLGSKQIEAHVHSDRSRSIQEGNREGYP